MHSDLVQPVPCFNRHCGSFAITSPAIHIQVQRKAFLLGSPNLHIVHSPSKSRLNLYVYILPYSTVIFAFVKGSSKPFSYICCLLFLQPQQNALEIIIDVTRHGTDLRREIFYYRHHQDLCHLSIQNIVV